MDSVTGLSLSINWKNNNYDLILVIIDRLSKLVHYKLVEVTINASKLAEVSIDMVVQYYGLPDSIIINCKAIFTCKFRSLLCYFLSIK